MSEISKDDNIHKTHQSFNGMEINEADKNLFVFKEYEPIKTKKQWIWLQIKTFNIANLTTLIIMIALYLDVQQTLNNEKNQNLILQLKTQELQNLVQVSQSNITDLLSKIDLANSDFNQIENLLNSPDANYILELNSTIVNLINSTSNLQNNYKMLSENMINLQQSMNNTQLAIYTNEDKNIKDIITLNNTSQVQTDILNNLINVNTSWMKISSRSSSCIINSTTNMIEVIPFQESGVAILSRGLINFCRFIAVLNCHPDADANCGFIINFPENCITEASNLNFFGVLNGQNNLINFQYTFSIYNENKWIFGTSLLINETTLLYIDGFSLI
jgi:hypothetical protein